MSVEEWKGPGRSHCTWNKFPKGFVAPTHYHTKDLHSVVIAGNWGSWVEGAPEKLVGPGGYEFIPGGLKHSTKCSEAADCLTYECSGCLRPQGSASAAQEVHRAAAKRRAYD
jgi:hypothetical protein